MWLELLLRQKECISKRPKYHCPLSPSILRHIYRPTLTWSKLESCKINMKLLFIKYQHRVRYIALKIYLKFTEPKSNVRANAWSIPRATHSITSVMIADCWYRICCLKTTRHKLKYTWKYPCLQVIKMIYEKVNVMAYYDSNDNLINICKNFNLQLMDPGRNGVIIHHVRWPVEQGPNQEQGLAPRHPLHEADGIAMVSS